MASRHYIEISFALHENGVFMKFCIPLALLAAVRAFAYGVDAEFTVMPRSFFRIYPSSHLPPLRIGLDDDLEGL